MAERPASNSTRNSHNNVLFLLPFFDMTKQKQPQRPEVSLQTFQPPLVWTVTVSQESANLEVAIMEDGTCIDGVVRAQSKATCKRSSTGFFRRDTGDYVGSTVVHALVSTDRFKVEDLSASTGAGFTRGYRDGDRRRLSKESTIVLDVNMNRRTADINLAGMLGVSAKVEPVNKACVNPETCAAVDAFPPDLPVVPADSAMITVSKTRMMNKFWEVTGGQL